ncbi:hypothetical protein ASPCAL00762 [Aspergillus calidoustus]|uniref:Uncharacterized protein n=1 Tax=Aspergillus calidoustus TaxID=454130 RepID=A0A0U4YW51_ASPCI|nr:hypothetical protein ASPCAL00762 [Aspergillus calidoustus]
MGTAQLHLDFLADIPGVSFPARLLLTSFRQHVGFTYYEYRLQLWISTDVTTEKLENAKQQCARAAQETYNRDLRAVIRHDFVFKKEEYASFLSLLRFMLTSD